MIDIMCKISIFQLVCGTIWKTFSDKINTTLTIKSCKAVTDPLRYMGVSESYVLGNNEKRRIVASEMKSLRSVESCVLRNRFRNYVIRNELLEKVYQRELEHKGND